MCNATTKTGGMTRIPSYNIIYSSASSSLIGRNLSHVYSCSIGNLSSCPLMTAEVVPRMTASGCVVVLAHAPSEATEFARHSKPLGKHSG